MASNFKYAGVSDLQKYFNRAVDYDNKRQVFSWTQEATLDDFGGTSNVNVWYATNTGLVTQLYQDGRELTSLSANLDTKDTELKSSNMGNTVTTIDVDSTTNMAALDVIKINNEYIQIVAVSDGDTITFSGKRNLFGSMQGSAVADADVFLAVDESVVDVSDYGWFFYDSALDMCVVAVPNDTNPNSLVMEAGTDYTTFIEQTLVDASLELHNYLDMRYSTPLEKAKQIDTDTATVSVAEEYDSIIVKATCYIATTNLIRAKEGASEEADYFYSLVTNEEKTGLIDKLNLGTYKLSSEVDANDKKGKIKFRNVSGTMDIVELSGEYHGEGYDLLKVEIEDSGSYGNSTFKVHYLSNDQLFGATSSTEKITGGLQHLHGGLYCRFQGASATDGDIWEVEVYGSHRKQTNKSNSTIEMVR
tara:strand:+ start:2233 stop:3486 length:1254 start_codon:yes stop_codon:yes gene_type:complete